jgi:hypothetical protein
MAALEERELSDSVTSEMRNQTNGSLDERKTSFGVTDEERQEARKFRATALKEGGMLFTMRL